MTILMISRQKRLGDQWYLRHTYFNQHNHPPTPNPFTLDPHRSRQPGRLEAIQIAKTHVGKIPYRLSKSVLKDLDLSLDRKTFYNLSRKEQAHKLSPQEEALMLLHHLESSNVHVVVEEQYVRDIAGNKKDRVIECIVWWTPEQIRMARRFVSDMLAQTDATFNTNEKRLLLQLFVGVDNTGATFQFLQAFTTSESARIIRFLLQVLEDHFFYDCPGFAVLGADFGKGLSTGFAQKAAQDAEDAEKKRIGQKEKQIQQETSRDELQLEYYPLPTASARPDYEADSQTIIVDSDWVRAVKPTIIGVNQIPVILQFCEWHAAEAIKRRLIAKGYKKESRDELIDLIWKWIKAPDLDKLEDARNMLILSLKVSEKEYLTEYYQPKEPQFCRAYTSQYRNLGQYSTARSERNHQVQRESANLNKNLTLSDAVLHICNSLESLADDYENRLSRSRISEPRLIDRDFFRLVLRRVTHFCLEKCSIELVQAKELYDKIQYSGKNDDKFDPDIGCERSCQLPRQFGLPCKHWMLHFYRKNEPVPINLFHPRWLIDGPSVLREPWHLRLDNHDFSKGQPIEDRYVGDRATRAGEQLIIDTSLAMVEKHKNLPPGEKETFAQAFKKMCDTLVQNQEERLKRLQAIPRRLPDQINQPKVTFIPGRKRALTGREAAELQEKEEARQRRRAQIEAERQAQNDDRQEQYTLEVSQLQAEIAEVFQRVEEASLPTPRAKKTTKVDGFADIATNLSPTDYVYSSQPKRQTDFDEVINISSDTDNDEWLDIEDNEKKRIEQIKEFKQLIGEQSPEPEPAPTPEKVFGPESDIDETESSSTSSKDDDFLDIDAILSPTNPPIPPRVACSSSRPTRERKATTKQASQNRRAIEKELKKAARLVKKPMTSNTTQLDHFELPYHSS